MDRRNTSKKSNRLVHIKGPYFLLITEGKSVEEVFREETTEFYSLSDKIQKYLEKVLPSFLEAEKKFEKEYLLDFDTLDFKSLISWVFCSSFVTRNLTNYKDSYDFFRRFFKEEPFSAEQILELIKNSRFYKKIEGHLLGLDNPNNPSSTFSLVERYLLELFFVSDPTKYVKVFRLVIHEGEESLKDPFFFQSHEFPLKDHKDFYEKKFESEEDYFNFFNYPYILKKNNLLEFFNKNSTALNNFKRLIDGENILFAGKETLSSGQKEEKFLSFLEFLDSKKFTENFSTYDIGMLYFFVNIGAILLKKHKIEFSEENLERINNLIKNNLKSNFRFIDSTSKFFEKLDGEDLAKLSLMFYNIMDFTIFLSPSLLKFIYDFFLKHDYKELFLEYCSLGSPSYRQVLNSLLNSPDFSGFSSISLLKVSDQRFLRSLKEIKVENFSLEDFNKIFILEFFLYFLNSKKGKGYSSLFNSFSFKEFQLSDKNILSKWNNCFLWYYLLNHNKIPDSLSKLNFSKFSVIDFADFINTLIILLEFFSYIESNNKFKSSLMEAFHSMVFYYPQENKDFFRTFSEYLSRKSAEKFKEEVRESLMWFISKVLKISVEEFNIGYETGNYKTEDHIKMFSFSNFEDTSNFLIYTVNSIGSPIVIDFHKEFLGLSGNESVFSSFLKELDNYGIKDFLSSLKTSSNSIYYLKKGLENLTLGREGVSYEIVPNFLKFLDPNNSYLLFYSKFGFKEPSCTSEVSDTAYTKPINVENYYQDLIKRTISNFTLLNREEPNYFDLLLALKGYSKKVNSKLSTIKNFLYHSFYSIPEYFSSYTPDLPLAFFKSFNSKSPFYIFFLAATQHEYKHNYYGYYHMNSKFHKLLNKKLKDKDLKIFSLSPSDHNIVGDLQLNQDLFCYIGNITPYSDTTPLPPFLSYLDYAYLYSLLKAISEKAKEPPTDHSPSEDPSDQNEEQEDQEEENEEEEEDNEGQEGAGGENENSREDETSFNKNDKKGSGIGSEIAKKINEFFNFLKKNRILDELFRKLEKSFKEKGYFYFDPNKSSNIYRGGIDLLPTTIARSIIPRGLPAGGVEFASFYAIALIDNSGSMHSPHPVLGKPIVELAYGLLKTVSREYGCPIFYFIFTTDIVGADKVSPEESIKEDTIYSGGTSLDSALNSLLQCIKGEKHIKEVSHIVEEVKKIKDSVKAFFVFGDAADSLNFIENIGAFNQAELGTMKDSISSMKKTFEKLDLICFFPVDTAPNEEDLEKAKRFKEILGIKDLDIFYGYPFS